ncbi:MAG: hexose kinase [Defluviitaleaceae bacterium]|nr:hexose kinase [Defluviitaleaceae bacterium]
MNIIAVNLNPCIDWMYTVKSYTRGGLNRVQHIRSDIAGKGINVAIALKNLGLEPVCTGFNFIENGEALTSRLNELSIGHDFVECEGAIRTNIKLYEESTGVMTELNQSGAFVSEELQSCLLGKIKTLNVCDDDILILSGSCPQGVAADFYARICDVWCGRVFLDTEGEALRVALARSKIFAVKPNLFELESTFGGQSVKTVQEKIMSRGVKIACVSMGSDGAFLVSSKNEYRMPALSVTARGVAGAGDAMVAGLVYAVVHGMDEHDYLPAAMAAAAASVILEGTEMCTLSGFREMLEKIGKSR